MSISGTLKADQLTLARLTISWTNEPIQLSTVAALVSSKAGTTHGWVNGSGVQWSKATGEALTHLKECIERDMGEVHMHGVQGGVPTGKGLQISEGLSEHLGAAEDDVPPA